MPSHSSDLAVVTVYFNPCGYQSTVANFLQFYESIKQQELPFFAAELAFDEAPFYLPELRGVSRIRTCDVLWQKDRMLNHLIAQLPRCYTKVAWIDADVLFDNDSWHEQAAKALDEFLVVQPYATAVWLNQNGGEVKRSPGIAAASQRERERLACHPGFAWAAQRGLLEKHGLFDACILGGNDRIFAHALYGLIWPELLGRYPRALQQEIVNWTRRVFADACSQVGYVEGLVRHLWHGEDIYRQYFARDRILLDADYNPRADVYIGEDGAWRWATEKPSFHEAVRNFFWSRREDGDSVVA